MGPTGTTPAFDASDSSPPAASATSSGRRSTVIPQFALDQADAKIASWSSAVVDAADTIERFVTSDSSPVPESARELAISVTQKLRSLGTTASEQQAAEIVEGLQARAAAHPAAALGIGAVIGAALAGVLVRFGTAVRPADATRATSRKR